MGQAIWPPASSETAASPQGSCGRAFRPVTMGLRPTNRHEKRGESLQHPINGPVLVKVEAAVGGLRPSVCLIWSVRLNERVRKKRERVLSYFPVRSPVWSGGKHGKVISDSSD